MNGDVCFCLNISITVFIGVDEVQPKLAAFLLSSHSSHPGVMQ